MKFTIRPLSLSLLLACAAMGTQALAEQQRLALVIGNAAYAEKALKNPLNDARAMKKALEEAGFTVTLLENADRQGMESAINTFGARLNADDVGLFYFSGHGMQQDGDNYLLPLDISAQELQAKQLPYKAVNAGYVLNAMRRDGKDDTGLNIFILDACRDAPSAGSKSMSRGLAPMNARAPGSSVGTLIAYAAAPGETAQDGSGNNSPYTASLIKQMKQPLPIEYVLKKVLGDVKKETGKQQEPWYSSSIEGDFYFTQPPAEERAMQIPLSGTSILAETAGKDRQENIPTTIQEAVEAYHQGDYAKVRQLVEPLANKGDAVAQNLLGVLYHNGQGVQQDYTKAREYYEKAAAQGNADAQNNLAILYYNGLGMEKDYDKAHEWWEKAAAQNNMGAQFQLGNLYYHGIIVEKNHNKAREWWERAAAQGDFEAQNALGFLYSKGQGIKQDYVKAREWYEKAAAQGYATAQNNLGSLYMNGNGVEQDYGKAREYFERAAAQGYEDAYTPLGWLYERGLGGVQQDYAKAHEWYEKAAAQGNDAAQNNLGVLYYKGLGVAKNPAKAREWAEKAVKQGNNDAKELLKALDSGKEGAADSTTENDSEIMAALQLGGQADNKKNYTAAEKGNAEAQYWLAILYEHGRGTKQNYAKARQWYEKAAKQGDINAQVSLGQMYKDGKGGKQDYSKARQWWEKAAQKGSAYAQKRLGDLYSDGHGVKQDYDKARQWWEKAAAQNNGEALSHLGWFYENGKGGEPDYAKARQYYQKAAAIGIDYAKEGLQRLEDK